jgi:hypothetical protein
LAAAPDCVKVLAATGVVRFVKRFGLTLLGANSPDEVVGSSYVDLWPVAMHQAIRDALSGAVPALTAGRPVLAAACKERL